MYICVRAFACNFRYIIHTAWATVLLFVTKGNTRASVSGTAIVQSRFFYTYIESGTQTKQCPAFLCIVTYMKTDGQPTVNRQSTDSQG